VLLKSLIGRVLGIVPVFEAHKCSNMNDANYILFFLILYICPNLILIIANKFSQAIELYSEAIELNESNAVYWANRAFAHTKLEEYGSAISDATKAIEVDPRYSKVD
jgi:tetratricopeptide (TPR) repeat protein